MKTIRTTSTMLALLATLLATASTVHALDDLVISEFMAENTTTLADEDGNFEDWIEIYNSGTNTVNLSGWSLTDNAGNLTKWRFPVTNLNQKAFLIVFASNKDRKIPGRPLHTNFRLDNDGEFLALVKPDGTTIVSAFSPLYPQQAPDISYGVATVPTVSLLISNGSAARFTVPLNGNLGLDWIAEGFNDSSWGNVTNGVGFENNSTAVIADGTVVADSLADWSSTGVQGFNNWFYGAWVKTNASQTYAATRFAAYPSGTGPHSSANFWDGAAWRWFDGEPPFDTIARDYTRPSIFATGGTNSLEHQVVRRWVSEITGPVSIDWRMAKKNPTGSGVTGRVYHNNAVRDTMTLVGADVVGQAKTIATFNVATGDTIDFVLEPGADIIGDDTFFNATIRGATTLAGQFRTDVGGLMTNINSSAYLRLPFNVADAAAIAALKLRIKYDDGFVAYLNGSLILGPIVSRNAPDPAVWNSSASGSRADSDASQVEEIDLSHLLDLLHNGVNMLAIHGLNSSSADGDFLIAADLEATVVTVSPSTRNYFLLPTPGSANGAGTTTLGPIITRVQHEPHEPTDSQDLYVTARLDPTFNAVASVQLYYRVMFGPEISVPMLDNGLNADGLAGDGVYGAIIPNAASTEGQMIRYYVIATDSANNQSRQPPPGDVNNSSLYFGTVVQDSSLTNALPVLHWFTQNTISSTTFRSVSMYWRGEFYDNIKMNTHGQSSGGFRNHSFNVDFNPDHNFKPDANLPRVDDINLLSSYADKSHMRVMLSYQIYQDSGPRAPTHFVVPARMQSNGVFHSIMHIVENGDDKYLKRLGRDPNGALYKMYTSPVDPNQAEKKTRRWEDKSDFQALVSGLGSATNRVYIHDNVDISEAVNFYAAMIVTASVDCCHKNFYLYRDSDGDGEWEMLPWDLDLSFGRNWQSGETYWDDRVYPNNGLFIGGTFPLGPLIFTANSTTRAQYLRRVRTLQDELLQTNGTPALALNFEKQIDYWRDLMAADGVLDLDKWGTWGGGQGGAGGPSGPYIGPTSPFWRTLPQAAEEMKTNYLVNRRKFVFEQKMNQLTEFPDAQPTNAVVLVGALDYNPSSGNQKEEYLQLINTNNYAVDISGWQLSGAVDHIFQGGVVIPRAGSSNILYVVADKKAFRARSVSPRGGQGLYIEGPYKGQLSARGETIVLSDKAGRIVTTNTYLGNPSPAQQSLRITELMYHPPNPPAGSPYDAEEFEYIELKNIGSTTLNLAGVRFVAGVEFSFTGSAITSLAPGQFVLVVKNLAAFTSRYGSGLPLAGQYIGFLSNGGENLRLDDAVGEKILDFDYNNSWYPITDGPGASLVILNENAVWNTWGSKSSWRPSAVDFGSPGQNDPSPVTVLPVLVNEALTHTDLPAVDQIELFNPNAVSVDIGGWFLSDNFSSPKKYRIPNGRVIAAGGYMTFTEADFNVPGSPTAFSLSSKGEEVYVFAGNGTNLVGYFHGFAFGAAANGVSFGRYVNSQTNTHFVAQISNTPDAANSGPRVGPVVFSEINYHPVDLPGGIDNNVDEYVELANITSSPVALFNTTNTWRLRGGVDYNFPGGITIPANGYLLVVGFNPTNTPVLNAFRGRYNVPAGVQILGPFSGQLSNNGEELRLTRPDSPDIDGVPYILVDAVEYSNQAPWSAAADGIGPSLQKLVVTSYGNDPINWTGVGPSPGSAYVAGGTLPVVTQQPVNTAGVAGKTASFSVGVSGSAPLFYQWRFNGANIYGANNSMLVLNQLKPSQAGSYSCIVFNSAGSTESLGATLTIFFPPSITEHPADVKVMIKPDSQAAPTTNATFSVAGTSSTALRYQWYFNGNPILNATNTSYTVVNVGQTNLGQFVCALTDSIDTVFSKPATLYPMIRPAIVTVPASQTVAVNSLFGLSVAYSGFPPPFTNEWRRGSLPIATTVSYTTNDVLALFAADTAGANTYRVVIKNIANPAPGVATGFATITTLDDTDGDGIPDTVETALGLNPNDDADGNGDLDGDKMSNRDEYAAGTDPQNPASFLKVAQTTVPGTAIITVAAVANRSYSVQYTDGLDGGQWLKLGDVVAKPADRVEQLTDTSWTSQRFYRIVLPGQP